MRDLTELEEMNTEYLRKNGIQYDLICLTHNILRHGIFDAKSSLRKLLQKMSVHDYSLQKPGEKVSIKTHILTFKEDIETSSSMYRSETRGDARMWFGKEIYKIAKPDDIFAIIPKNGLIYVIPISRLDIKLCCSSSITNPIKALFTP